jgi:hypothetical protein
LSLHFGGEKESKPAESLLSKNVLKDRGVYAVQIESEKGKTESVAKSIEVPDGVSSHPRLFPEPYIVDALCNRILKGQPQEVIQAGPRNIIPDAI